MISKTIFLSLALALIVESSSAPYEDSEFKSPDTNINDRGEGSSGKNVPAIPNGLFDKKPGYDREYDNQGPSRGEGSYGQGGYGGRGDMYSEGEGGYGRQPNYPSPGGYGSNVPYGNGGGYGGEFRGPLGLERFGGESRGPLGLGRLGGLHRGSLLGGLGRLRGYGRPEGPEEYEGMGRLGGMGRPGGLGEYEGMGRPGGLGRLGGLERPGGLGEYEGMGRPGGLGRLEGLGRPGGLNPIAAMGNIIASRMFSSGKNLFEGGIRRLTDGVSGMLNGGGRYQK